MDERRKGLSFAAGGNVTWFRLFGRQYGNSSKNVIELPLEPAIPFLEIYAGDQKLHNRAVIYTSISIAALFTVSIIWKHPEYSKIYNYIKKPWYIFTMEYYTAI